MTAATAPIASRQNPTCRRAHLGAVFHHALAFQNVDCRKPGCRCEIVAPERRRVNHAPVQRRKRAPANLARGDEGRARNVSAVQGLRNVLRRIGTPPPPDASILRKPPRRAKPTIPAAAMRERFANKSSNLKMRNQGGEQNPVCGGKIGKRTRVDIGAQLHFLRAAACAQTTQPPHRAAK